MSPVSVLPALVAVLVALLGCAILQRLAGIPPAQGRFLSIDGLRGHLAFLVFLHHSCIWFFYLRSGRWEVPPSNLYTHFGQSSVALFFMITGFLFYSKLLDSRQQGVDWIRLLLSRVLRLAPLYLCVLGLLLFIVLCLSGWTLQDSPARLLLDSLRWASFTLLGNPDLNGVQNTFIILAGVTWSLPYEWLFYLALPVLGLTTGLRAPLAMLCIGLLSLLICFLRLPEPIHLLAFLGGILAALLVRVPVFCRLSNSHTASVAVLLLAGLAVSGYPSALSIVPLALLAMAFSLIAGGCNLFGLLTCSVSRTLGEMAYSIYLLHGLLLFCLFHFILGRETAGLLSPVQHWLLVIACIPVVLIVCHGSFRLIEQPAMQQTGTLMRWLRRSKTVPPATAA